MDNTIEIVPAILRTTFEKIAEEWNAVVDTADHIHIDMTDGIFAGDKGFLNIVHLADLPESRKIELHMMVQTPGDFVDDIIDLNPGRCIFHIEAFSGKLDLPFVYNTIGEYTSTELGLAINPETNIDRLTEYLPIVQYILFMGYKPGKANQDIDPTIFEKIRTFHIAHPTIVIAADGHVGKDTITDYVQAGATTLCANTAIFGAGNPKENIEQLRLLAEASS
jgi:ribulose-phosphate 3-epimerase